jgi:Arc/MetJ-type ribon-helix-helix transcriptional regulator
MNTITVPITKPLNDFIEEQVRIGNASSKADLVRRAIQQFKEEEFIRAVLKAEQEISDGKGLRGDLKTLAKGFE